MRTSFSLFLISLLCFSLTSLAQTGLWMKYEKQFESKKSYGNPLYDVKDFSVRFTSPTGKIKTIRGFWDGGTTFRVRFAPDETGSWTYVTTCSDSTNSGLHKQTGSFSCVKKDSPYDIYTKGSIIHPKGSYYLTHADGTPFFYTACTAWNGPIKSTDAEWDTYLKDRVANHYNVIQFATTQWRGASKNSTGQVAFTGSGRIEINTDFFKLLDKKIDEINAHGLIAAPVLLWALPVSTGRELSPGYYLPEPEAIALGNYLVARYGGHQVIWFLGGDGQYVREYEQRWKTIGRGIFGKEHPGVVAMHPQGGSWIGNEYAHEDWVDILGFQSGHNASPRTQEWITEGPVAREWTQLPPKVFINLEPCYEDIVPGVNAPEVRNASYWSVFSTPVAGISYGANAIWPWIRAGEEIENHSKPHILRTWEESIKLPGSVQVGYLANFMRQYAWWQLKPAQQLLVSPTRRGEFVSVVRSDDRKTIMAYVPKPTLVKLYNPGNDAFEGKWFDAVANKTTAANLVLKNGFIEATPTASNDAVLILTKK
ncbi:apiosidase-like domain-containing protein [Arundinibacter roseus]|uniref:DUF4038 domain-containing protein n=1 Tax=Arundinibacter roseus TaxID=2070510 RepID=A0A4R4K4H1_9BACT|nr:DUF4038 domain-containing protein [Arundinibacter roseus]TDB62317.1 DUF4038 domain-containing protein [Arundinibacter roseus]